MVLAILDIHCPPLTKRSWYSSIFRKTQYIYKSKTGMNMLHMNKNINDPFHWMVTITLYMQVSGLCYWSSAQLSRIVMIVSRHMATSMMFTNRWCLSIVNWWIIDWLENRSIVNETGRAICHIYAVYSFMSHNVYTRWDVFLCCDYVNDSWWIRATYFPCSLELLGWYSGYMAPVPVNRFWRIWAKYLQGQTVCIYFYTVIWN